MKNNTMKRLLVMFILCGLMSACTINSHIMLKTNKDYEFDQLLDIDNSEYKISINDFINFRLFTNDGFEVIDMTSMTDRNNMGLLNQSNIIQYIIRKDSLVELPIIGNINLVDKTIEEAENLLEELYSKFYVDPYINLRVNSRRVIVFPGTGSTAQVVPLMYNNTTLIEALALVGGITGNSRANRVKLIRNNKGNQEVYLIDLSTIEGLNNANTILQSNDIIYVEPNPNYAREILQDISPILSVITSFTSLITSYIIINQL